MEPAGPFAFRRVAPLGGPVDDIVTPARAVFTNGRPTVVHFYNGG